MTAATISAATLEVLAALKRAGNRQDWPGCQDHNALFREGCQTCERLAGIWGKPVTRVQLIAAVRELAQVAKGTP